MDAKSIFPSFRIAALMVAGVTLFAYFSAIPYAGGANDGSLLATTQSLVDRGTFVIDDSIFVVVPPRVEGKPGPYHPRIRELEQGTRDKVYIRGHYYSHKPPVLSMLMAGIYAVLHVFTGLSAVARPDLFCKLLTFGSAGISYVVAILFVWKLYGQHAATRPRQLVMTLLFGLGTLALPYMRSVNSHIVLLASATALFLCFEYLAKDGRHWRASIVITLGMLAGLGYTIDAAVGTPLLAAAAILVLYHTQAFTPALLFALGAMPWLAAHHAVTYAIAGTIGPHAAVPEYFRWPGSPFEESNLTGIWRNQSIGHYLTYGGELLFGRKRGFFINNLPLLLMYPALLVLWRHRRAVREWPEVLMALACSGGTVLLYVLLSVDYSGACASVRSFVPLLAAGFYLIAVAARYDPTLLDHLGVLVGWSLACGAFLWRQAAWGDHAVSILWLVEVLGIAHWLLDRIWRTYRTIPAAPPTTVATSRAA